MIKLSIIVPVYNAEKTIRNCVASIQSQNCHNIEIILVNDGSKDGSLPVCNKMAENDDRIIVLDGENAGVSVARNKGMDRARGEYIAFVDADDSVETDIYSEMFDVIEKTNALIVFCNYKEVDEFGGEKAVDQITSFGTDMIKPIKVIDALISVSETALFGVVWRSVFKRDIIIRNNIRFTPKLTMAEDLQFLLKYLACIDTVGLCPSYLYDFKVSVQSTTGKYMKNQDTDMRYVNDWMLSYVKGTIKDELLLTNVYICMANTTILNIANVCKQGTPYSLFQRIKYANKTSKNKNNRYALSVAQENKNIVVGKRYWQIIIVKNNFAFINVLYHSIKNKTVMRQIRKEERQDNSDK